MEAPPAVGTAAQGAEAGDEEAPVWRLASGSSASDDEAPRIFFFFLSSFRPRHFDLGSLGVPTLVPPHLGLGAYLRHEGSLSFGVELLHHARRTWGCEKNAEAAPSGGSDGLLYLLGAAGCALGAVGINQELGL